MTPIKLKNTISNEAFYNLDANDLKSMIKDGYSLDFRFIKDTELFFLIKDNNFEKAEIFFSQALKTLTMKNFYDIIKYLFYNDELIEILPDFLKYFKKNNKTSFNMFFYDIKYIKEFVNYVMDEKGMSKKEKQKIIQLYFNLFLNKSYNMFIKDMNKNDSKFFNKMAFFLLDDANLVLYSIT